MKAQWIVTIALFFSYNLHGANAFKSHDQSKLTMAQATQLASLGMPTPQSFPMVPSPTICSPEMTHDQWKKLVVSRSASPFDGITFQEKVAAVSSHNKLALEEAEDDEILETPNKSIEDESETDFFGLMDDMHDKENMRASKKVEPKFAKGLKTIASTAVFVSASRKKKVTFEDERITFPQTTLDYDSDEDEQLFL